MLFPSFASLVSLGGLVVAVQAFSLYGFAPNIQGFDLIYADGLAYISSNGTTPANSTTATNVTFEMTNTTLVASANTTGDATSGFSGTKELYIVAGNNSIAQVGFIDSNSTAPSDADTSGFVFYGRQLQWANPNGNVEAQFWARDTGTLGLWALIWNNPNVNLSLSTPVQLKTTPLPSLSST